MSRRHCAGGSCRSTVASALLLIFVLARAPVTRAAYVTLNEDGVLLIDGRKILPIGFTGGPPPDGRTPEGKPALEEIHAAGGTFFRTGLTADNSWNDGTALAQEQIWMDAAARHGLYCWPRLERLSSLKAARTSQDARLGWNWTFWRRILRPVLEEVGNHSPLAPALVAPDSRLPIKVEDAPDVEVCVREVGNDLYILACKREGQTVAVRFTGLPVWATAGAVLYESPRRVQAEAGRFTDWFAPFDVHVYHFRRQD